MANNMRADDDRRKSDRRVEQHPKNEPIAVERRQAEQRSGKDRRS